MEEMETCISIASGKRPISHSGFDLQASSPSCVARWAGHSPPALSPQPILGCQDHTSLISERLICMMSSWVLGLSLLICPALFCPAGSPCRLDFSWGTCFQKPCSARPRGCLESCPPLCQGLGPDFCWAVQVTQQSSGLLPIYHMAYVQYQSLAVPTSALVSPAETSCPGAEGLESAWAIGNPLTSTQVPSAGMEKSPGLHSRGAS